MEERDSTAEAAGAGTTAETGAAQGDTEQPPSAALAGKSELDIEEAERFAASFRPSWEPDAPPTPVIPPAQFVGASGGAARVIRHSTRSDLSAPKLRKRRGAAYAILGASLLGVAGVLYMAIASSSVRPSAELARLTDSTETRIEAMKAPQPAAAPAQPAAAATAEPTAPNAQAAAVDPNAQPGAADPNAQPVDPNAQPVSPNAQPVSPNAQLAAVSPNAQPVDPNAQIAAVDPNTQAAAPSAQAVGPNAPAAAANPSAVHAGTDPNAQATNAAAIPSAEPNAPVAAANPSAAHAGTNPNAPAVAAAPSAQPVTAPPSNPTAVRPGTNATTAEGQSGVPDIKTPEAAGGALAAAKTATPLPRMPSPQPQAAAERRAPDKASQVLLSLAAHPPSTKLRLDGVPIENPFRGRLPRSSKHRIEARAPGYAPEVHAVRLENDVQLMISLKRDPPANVKPDPYRDQRRAAAAAQSTPPRNRGAGFVSENPY